MSPMTTAQLELKRKPSRRRVSDIPPNLRMTAYLLEQLLRHDRQARVIRPPRDRREWGIARLTDYLRAIGAEIAGGGEAALWEALRVTVALQPTRREEGLIRLIRLWPRSATGSATRTSWRHLCPAVTNCLQRRALIRRFTTIRARRPLRSEPNGLLASPR